MATKYLLRLRRCDEMATRYHLERDEKLSTSVFNLRVGAPSHADLLMIREIRVGDLQARLDFALGIVSYEGLHADPLYCWEQDDLVWVEITLYDVRPACHDAIALITDSGVLACAMPSDLPLPPVLPVPVASALEKTARGWVLRIEAELPCTLIWQRVVWGRFEERHQPLAPGLHQIPVEAAFADYYGCAISCSNAAGDSEHKHILFGEFGKGSGRDLIDAATGQVFAAATGWVPAYRSAICRVDAAANLAKCLALLADYDEVEILTPPSEAMACHAWLAGGTTPVRVHTFADAGDAVAADVTLLDPHMPPARWGDGRYSTLLFADADAPDYADSLIAALTLATKAPPTARVLERLWFQATIDPVRTVAAGYGAGFSHTRSVASREKIQAAQVAVQRVRLQRRSPCASCAWHAPCAHSLTYPWPGQATHPPVFRGEQCELALRFERVSDDGI